MTEQETNDLKKIIELQTDTWFLQALTVILLVAILGVVLAR